MKIGVVFILFLNFSFFSFEEEPQKLTSISDNGEELYTNNCAMCHLRSQPMVGPPLMGVNSKRNKKWLISFISNGNKLIMNKDTIAYKLYLEYDKREHPNFEDKLSKQEIKSLLVYIESWK